MLALETNEVPGPMVSKLFRSVIPTRWLIRYVRRPEAGWALIAVGWLVSLVAQVSPWGVALVTLAGLVLCWEGVGRTAQGHAGILNGSSAGPGWQGFAALLAGVLTTLSFALAHVMSLRWAVGPGEGSLNSVILLASCVAGWLLLNVFRQSWRLPVALAVLFVMTVAGVLITQRAALFPVPVGGSILDLWVRTTVLVMSANMIRLWLQPVGDVTHWSIRFLDEATVIPGLCALLALISRPVGGMAEWSSGWRTFFLITAIAMFLTTVAILSTRIARVWPTVRNSVHRFWAGESKANPDRLVGYLIFGSIPPLLFAINGGWLEWSISLALYLISACLLRLPSNGHRSDGHTPSVRREESATPTV